MSPFAKALWAALAYVSVAYALFRVTTGRPLPKGVNDGGERKLMFFFSLTWVVWLAIFVCFVVGASMDALTKSSSTPKK